MADTQETPKKTGLRDPDPESEPAGTVTDSQAQQQSEPAQPRLIEEHHILGPNGEDEIEATDDRGRRWYHLRPEPRGRADLIGFNYTWWLIWIFFLFIVFLPWGPGWGY
jgi:hypothetical protein